MESVEHRWFKRYCPISQRWQSPRVNSAGQASGQERVGMRLLNLLAWLRTRFL